MIPGFFWSSLALVLLELAWKYAIPHQADICMMFFLFTPVYNFIINRLADESAVLKPLSLHNNRYWSDLPAFQYLCSFIPYNCKVSRRFSAHSSLFQYSTGTSTKTTEYISSCHFRSGSMVLFSATCDIQEEVKDKIPCHSSIQVCKA